MELSVIVPIYNEGAGMQAFYDRIQPVVAGISSEYEIIYINDGSSDNSFSEIKRLAQHDSNVYYLNFSRNFGHQVAVMAGLDYCRGKVVAIIDGDLQDPPELIADMYRKYQEGYEVVYAKREKRAGESFLKKATAAGFYRLLKAITSIDIPVDTGDFRLIDRKVVQCLRNMPEKSKFLRGQIAWIGFRQTEVMYKRDSREYGETGYSYGKMLKLAMDAITGFSAKPLQFVSRLGITISGLAVVIILYALYSNLILDRVITGWTSLIISTMFFGGVQLISIGIIGEYVSRIHLNVQDRPLYIIDECTIEEKSELIADRAQERAASNISS